MLKTNACPHMLVHIFMHDRFEQVDESLLTRNINITVSTTRLILCQRDARPNKVRVVGGVIAVEGFSTWYSGIRSPVIWRDCYNLTLRVSVIIMNETRIICRTKYRTTHRTTYRTKYSITCGAHPTCKIPDVSCEATRKKEHCAL